MRAILSGAAPAFGLEDLEQRQAARAEGRDRRDGRAIWQARPGRAIPTCACSAPTPDLDPCIEGKNLTDEPTHRFQDGMRNWTIEDERYGCTVQAGVWARF